MSKYGIPYMGSKNRIAEDIINFLPSGKTLVDLFGGGGAITDCASKSGKWDVVIYNELDKLPHDCFIMALRGEFDTEDRWISREDFERLKDTDCYAACCFSFGNNFKDYMYSKEKEPLKKKCHEAIMSNPEYLKARNEIQFGKMQQTRTQNILRIENIERLERLQALKSEVVDNIIFYNNDYREVQIPEGSIIYCDIPYGKTGTYKKSEEFDYDAFYDWCVEKKNQGYEVYISEYYMPEDRFVEVWRKERQTSFSQTQSTKVIEKIFKVK